MSTFPFFFIAEGGITGRPAHNKQEKLWFAITWEETCVGGWRVCVCVSLGVILISAAFPFRDLPPVPP